MYTCLYKTNPFSKMKLSVIHTLYVYFPFSYNLNIKFIVLCKSIHAWIF